MTRQNVNSTILRSRDEVTLGVVCSSGGSSIMAAYDILRCCYQGRIRMVVVVDRSCPVIEECESRGIEFRHIEFRNRRQFSEEAKDLFEGFGVSLVFLYFLRIVGEELYKRIPTINFHPSLLPLFRGFGALRKTLENGCKFVGATAHVVNGKVDAGMILAQSVAPISDKWGIDILERISFVQKVYLSLVMFEQVYLEKIVFSRDSAGGLSPKVVDDGAAMNQSSNPALTDKRLIEEWSTFLEGMNLAPGTKTALKGL